MPPARLMQGTQSSTASNALDRFDVLVFFNRQPNSLHRTTVRLPDEYVVSGSTRTCTASTGQRSLGCQCGQEAVHRLHSAIRCGFELRRTERVPFARAIRKVDHPTCGGAAFGAVQAWNSLGFIQGVRRTTNDAPTMGRHNGLQSVRSIQFLQDASDVNLHGSPRQEQLAAIASKRKCEFDANSLRQMTARRPRTLSIMTPSAGDFRQPKTR